MAVPTESRRCVRFGRFELDLRTAELQTNGTRIHLQEKPFQILVALLEQPGEMVTREELTRRLWPAGTFVDFDLSLNKAVNRLREVLQDSAEQPRYIETLPRKGYRFIGPLGVAAVAIPSESHKAPSLTHPETSNKRWPFSANALAAAGVFALALFGFVLAKRVSSRQSSAPNHIGSLAVLPLQNVSGDPSQDYIADGMTDQLITDLGKLPSLRVISRTSVMQYKKVLQPLPQIARELKVDAVVVGTVSRSASQVRITAQLIEAATDRHLWAQSYEGDVRDLLGLQSQVARAIADEIRVNLTPQQQASLKTDKVVDPEAYEDYLKGRYFWNKRTEAGLDKSLDYFQRAIRKDPDYSLAYAGLADSYTMLAAGEYAVLSPAEAVPKAKAAAEKALQLDNALAEAHATLGYLIWSFDWDWQRAESEYQQAIALNPSYATAHHWYSIYLVEVGHFDEAVAEIRKAEALDPLSLIIHSDDGWILYNARRYDEAIEQLSKALEFDPTFASTHWTLGLAYGGKGMSQKAIGEFQKAVELSGSGTVYQAALGREYAVTGEREKALEILERLSDQSKHRYVLPDGPAYIYTALGDHDRALELLAQAYSQRTDVMTLLKVEPRLDALRSDPRFMELLRRVSFPP
jgi:TolB-like protein/DNA-binding winged helix-turn-helix (wHTH) protein/Flp pilus assembly protein TadD